VAQFSVGGNTTFFDGTFVGTFLANFSKTLIPIGLAAALWLLLVAPVSYYCFYSCSRMNLLA
jgi:hypothetical protein